ncbi:type IV pilus modification protein PilV [Pseudoalteromonas ruthenica]|uniref:Pilus assembly protein n=1 Tax=Pseudoalteromonas ruthenica TaxID=151081 RepID=A0A0F4Q0N7_9GAMM|nr:type IV pilus modification protein PilV [Pseudoalteromonas ruthenica]KJZ00874.1 pilus assembly protein [Pseudoalteromonas ruthenica]KJZ01073.1 pilus assembly protein [Pseudoalteromonas ruthenica]TMO85771.1 type IV pilus modification protein PilV [Pseudoalteromonas ruthenica]TMO92541.1 type IV pilus modification protein PilV [Pseudoalteromonas ruthenica]TMO99010.1 type IV pilus modification protein PilV [Pseudoalteromonas ruthenica]|tara:strand:- start:6809 stop:7375 length:567 start_codon:yes stop_codon:yes gene_type:complete
MSGRHSRQAHQSGFTLLEALIAFIILSVGLLGAVALQAKAKQASFDSMQRAAALALGNDIIQRIRANDVNNADTLYNFSFNSTEAIDDSANCQNNICSPEQLASFDRAQWQRAIRARENSGTLDNAVVCISPNRTNGPVTSEVQLTVVVTWEGRQALNGGLTGGVNCGDNNSERRALVLNSSVHLRAP